MKKLRKKQQQQQPNAIHIYISFPVIEKKKKKNIYKRAFPKQNISTIDHSDLRNYERQENN